MGDVRGAHAAGSGHVGRLRRSPQSRQLRRRLSVSLAVAWLVYTAVFAAVALLLNATLVPAVANRIADATSEWQRWDYVDYPLDKCLVVLDYSLEGIAPSRAEAEYVAGRLNEFARGDASAEGPVVVTDADGSQEMVEHSGIDAVQAVTAAQDRAAYVLASGSMQTLDPSTNLVLLDKKSEWFIADTLNEVVYQAVLDGLGARRATGSWNWQLTRDEEGVSGRDLSFYNTVRQFKLPVAAGLYLVGCIVLIFAGYGRAMRYFDELSSAVGGLIADKEKPVELSRALAPTQDELNAIRLASLADERAAKYAERRKDELVAYLAHDVKTPLTSVSGYLMLLEEAPDMPDAQRERYVATAALKAQRLETLIDEFFEITRYNLQAIPVERSNVEVRLLLEQVADEFYPEAQARGLRLEVDAPEDATAFVDPDKFARALGNVVRNAVAYADCDTSVTLAARADGSGWRIEVSNQGREISEAHLRSIFEKFYREDAARGTSSGGAGLGLAIAKEIVVAHGGAIEAQSDHGVTTFAIDLPA